MRYRKRVLVTGGRDFSDRRMMTKALLAHLPPDSLVVEGGARGADRLCREEALTLGHNVITVWANWVRFRKAAGPIRNAQMLGMDLDFVLAFPGGRGTANCVKQAQTRGIEVRFIGDSK